MVYHFLQRASSNVCNLANKNRFLTLCYMEYKDANMEGYLDEFNRRASQCDGLTDEDMETQMRQELMNSNALKLPMAESMKLPEDDHTITNLLEVR